MKGIEFEMNPDHIVFGFTFSGYESELGDEGFLFTIGFIVFNINFYC